MLSDRRHPCFRNFDSVVSIDVIRMKSYLDSLFDPTCVSVRVTIDKLDLIQIRLHSNNINRDNGIEIPEAWMPTIRKHNSRSTTKRTREGTSSANRNPWFWSKIGHFSTFF